MAQDTLEPLWCDYYAGDAPGRDGVLAGKA